MTTITRRTFSQLMGAAAAVSMIGVSSLAHAEVSGLELVAPSSPGSGYDQLARAMQAVLQEDKLASGIQIQNIAGGGGTVGLAQFITSRKRNPSALIVGFALVGGILTTKSAVNLSTLVPLARLMGEANVIVVPKNSDIKNMADLVTKLKANPKAFAWGGGSIGGIDHVMVGLLAKAAGVDPTQINFVVHAGGGEVMASVLGGHVTAAVSGYEEFRGQIESGDLRAIGISSPERQPGIGVPTFKEGGVDFSMINWRGLMGPPNMPAADKKAITEMVAAMVKSPAWKEALEKRGWLDSYQDAAQFGTFLTEETARVETALKAGGIIK